MSYRYILRYFIDPTYSAQERIEELARFCQGARVEEVMLLITPEELSAGHPTDRELDEAIALARRLRERLARDGVALSLNPWTTLYQVPRGRTLRPGQNWRLMVGETGETSPLVACPLCPEWQHYLAASFAGMAAEIGPVALWIEDDWRLHNHGGELGWGGCFCAEHLRRFSRRIGRETSREELLEKVLQPGSPHPWRSQWLALSRKTLLEPLRHVSQAIRTASPGIRIGLMSSQPDQHSMEGRDWEEIRRAIGDDLLLLRPHMVPYTQERPLRLTPAVTRQTIACLPGKIAIYPELENSPRCGVYSKSARFSVWQMLEAALIGSHGITINHFDMLGTGTTLDPSFEAALREAKPWLNTLAGLRLDDQSSEGAQVLFSPEIAAALHLPGNGTAVAPPRNGQQLARGFEDPSRLLNAGEATEGDAATFQRLYHPSIVWSEVCTILGIAHRLTGEIDPVRGPILVSGQTLRAFSREAITTLLGGVAVLDAGAVVTLLELGFGESIGIETATWQTLAGTAYAYEQICAASEADYGVRDPRMTAQRCSGRLLKMEPSKAAGVASIICNARRETLWPGMVVHRNRLGGSVLSLTYPVRAGAQFFMGFFNPYRRRFLQRLLLERSNVPLLTVGEEGARACQLRTPAGVLVAVLNPVDDPFPQVTLRWPKGNAPAGEWLLLERNGCWRSVESIHAESGPWFEQVTLGVSVEPLTGALLMNRVPGRASP
ncbi:MAG TPA: hypothetical protein VNQ90_18220 [Chthoniobacteraceae bacterium]|nr:hypothetical protein [Chthoniobacteraceae bacterium]